MNKRFVLFGVLIFAPIIIFAENIIVGKVFDAITRQAVDFVNVTIYKQGENIPVKGTSTDEFGQFEIQNMPNGTYTITYTFVGYLEQKKQIKLIGKKIDVGNVYLVEDSKQLAEIEVVGQGTTMRFELDKKVFSVDQNIASSGGTASDVLQNIPSVDVDNEGNISLRNSENVEVWINGKPSGLTAENRAQVLQQLPAESIKEIEVITNPSAKYNPEGTAGIINLVMKKDRKPGYYGSVMAGIRYPWGGIPGGQGGVNFNYSQGRVDAYVNIGYRYMSSHGTGKTERYNFQTTDTLRLLQTSENNRIHSGFFTRAGVNVRLSDKSTIGASGFGMFLSRNQEVSDTRNQFIQHPIYPFSDNVTGNVMRDFERAETTTSQRPGFNVELDYRVEFTKAQNLDVSASYSSFKRNQNAIYDQYNLLDEKLLESSQEQINNYDNGMWQFKADYTNKFTTNSRLEVGWQTTLRDRNSLADANDLIANLPMLDYYNKFDHSEQIHAVYATYGNRFWDKLSAQVGLRAEYMLRNTSTNDVQNAKKEYFELFPSAYISYTMPKGHEIQLNYTRRVNRPRGWQINPFRDFSDATNISYGNSDLMPQFASSLELNYLKNWDKHTLSAGVFYRFSDGVINRITYMNKDVMENTFINISKQQDVGMEVVGKSRLFGNFLQLTTSINAYYNELASAEYITPNDIKVVIEGQSTWAWSARLNAMMMFTKTFSGQITARYASPQVVAQGKRMQTYVIDIGLRKSFFNKALNLNLMVRDLLNSHGFRSVTQADDFYLKTNTKWSSRTIGLTVTYNFGNMKPQKRALNSGEADEEMVED